MVMSGDLEAIAKTLRAGAESYKDADKVKRHLQTAFTAKLTGPRSGRLYTTFFFTDKAGNVRPIGSRAPHQASAPGEPPAMDTGELLRRMSFSARRLPTGAEVKVKSMAEYSAFLEFGTSKMRARPYFRTTMREEAPAIQRIWRDGIVARERAKARELGGRG